jgi:two-component system nitrate/nitrite response regulator NarL
MIFVVQNVPTARESRVLLSLYKGAPKCKNSVSVLQIAARDGMANNGGEILIVDDDAGYRAFVVSVLARVGYCTRQAETGEEALSIAQSERPSCILLDVHLPGMTGYQVCQGLREEYGEGLPIIFVTGERTEPADRVAGLLLGADDYVVKPFDPDELLARVRRSLVRAGDAASERVGRASSFGLTPREQEVLALLAEGLKPNAIATSLFISPKTVGTHIQRILAKLGVHDRAQAVALAYREGLVHAPGNGYAAPSGLS